MFLYKQEWGAIIIEKQTKILTSSPEDIREAGKIIAEGGIVAFPTETVYGLGASALNGNAVKKIFAAKGRPSDNPLIVHIADKKQISEIAEEITPAAEKLINAFMPGPFTIILKKKQYIPDEVTAGLDTVGIRFPENETAAALIKAAGVPVAAPSANLSGKPSPTRAKHVKDDMTGRADAIIDGGDCGVGVESTIVDASGETPVILRPGGITLEDLRAVIPSARVDEHVLKAVSDDEKPKCPGMKYTHYSPDADVIVVEGERSAVRAEINRLISENRNKTIGVLTMYESAYDDAVILSAGKDNKEYAKNLFAALREFDALGADMIFAEFRETDGYGLAVKNRLYRAAGNNVIHV